MSKRANFVCRASTVLALLCGIFVSAGPLLWVFCASLKTGPDAVSPGFLPWAKLRAYLAGTQDWPLTYANYTTLLDREPFLTWTANSIFLSSTHTLLTVLLSSLGGFALAKYRFPGKRILMALMVLTMLLPSQVLLPSNYELIYRLGWINSYLAILIPGSVSVFGLFLFRQAMMGVPDDLLNSGRIDGCSEFRLWWSVAMPVVRPMTGAYTLMSFLSAWNSYLWPQVVLQDERKITLPMGLANMAALQSYQSDFGVLMAGTVLSILPVMLLFLWLQREFVEGLTSGAVKG